MELSKAKELIKTYAYKNYKDMVREPLRKRQGM